jgi:hypothetical protein
LTDLEYIHVKYNKGDIFGVDVVGVEIYLDSFKDNSKSLLLNRLIAGPSYIQNIFNSISKKITIRRELLEDGTEYAFFSKINKS